MNRIHSINKEIKYQIKKIEDNLITIIHNNNDEKYKKIIIHYIPQTREQMVKLKNELWKLKYNKKINDEMEVNLNDNWKVPEKILCLLPKIYLVQKVIEILYSNWAKIIDLRKISFIK